MKKFIGFYYRCSFNICLWVFLSLIGLMVLSHLPLPCNREILHIRYQAALLQSPDITVLLEML